MFHGFLNAAGSKVAALSLVIFAAPLAAQDLQPLPFTKAQSIGGGANYQNLCAACHGAQLEGFAAPPLSGDTFGWLDRPASEYHAYLQATMPANAIGTLTDAQVSTIMAFMAEQNGMTPGDTPIPLTAAELEPFKFGQ
ncbi:c-type cytochrome [Ketogulonicigenium vulgare]|uniref:Cytochrome c n=1 Tax=Ketogulonicigenium vulgare (strain WSH-001) TaxID=759362 RepID=F9YB56_KETVW|nr:c-type cytochrome [Ketogulonicigenium vulgare]ADO44085.1 putative cytochrome c, precursor [Ketogulonicigenium vulgare Y25]AEM42608.1 cytochrome c [Ketogulonicigenium vulgare WSH-001]ALJ82633.1 cytochrome C [Ketogulonicigenium vulgare]ANW35388.1 cytochrome C [Ketogulonicigenium vulgare]AOZ53310.1 cytochrome c, precursor [Ketogulonicigenium vulgare]